MSAPASALAAPGSARPDGFALGLALAALAALSLVVARDVGTRQLLLLWIGVGLGASLFHASFGFTGGWRALLARGSSRGVRAQILLLALSSVLFFPVVAGALPGVRAAAALAPVGLSVLAGAFLFGAGMQLGGGCGSGTLFTAGSGHVRMLVTLAFFVAGSLIGTAHLHWWAELPSIGRVSLLAPGWAPALAAQLAVLGALYLAATRWERRRHGRVRPLLERDGRPFLVRLVRGPWPLWWGAVALALLGLATLVVAGFPWSITFAFALWGAKLAQAAGVDVTQWPYWNGAYQQLALSRSVLYDTTSVMDFGLLLGAMAAAGAAGRFAPAEPLPARSLLAAVLGGLLMGYGARLAYGCNIGGMLAGIVTGSLHGWLWLAAGFAGSALGVRLRPWFGLDGGGRR